VSTSSSSSVAAGPHDDPVEALLAEWLERLDAGAAPDTALDALCASHPALADALRRRAALLADMGVLGAPARADDDVAPERLGRFRILRPLGGGGMGMVYLAHDEDLGREVALKVVRPDQLFHPGVRARFRREVEIIARLQHPGIVPVYAVGDEGGVPYFAMERVRGCSLDRALGRVRASGRSVARLSGADLAAAVSEHDDAEPADDAASADAAAPDTRPAPDTETPAQATGDDWLFAGTWEQACVRVTRQLAEALGHAHRRGVIHRDIKPSNVMLSRDRAGSRARLLDFGLAATRGAEGELTRSGSRLGSLHYMSPEQTRGESAQLGPAGDVYALGVTLYEMLTLRRPFVAGDDHGVIEAIRAGAAPSVREHEPTLSWEVATVVARAMDRDAENRYPDAEAFARDLGNVLAHRPVEARPTPPWRRARRWVQRRPTLAVALLLGTLLLVGAPLVFLRQQLVANAAVRAELGRTEQQRLRAETALAAEATAREHAEAQRERAEEQRRRAELAQARAVANQDLAVDAIDRMLTRLAAEELRYLPQLELLRARLLEDAVALSAELLASAGDDPAARRAAAAALERRGELLAALGRSDEALADLEAALEHHTTLAAAHPDDAALAVLRADAAAQLGSLMYQAGRSDDALALAQAEAARLADARARFPGEPALVLAEGRRLHQLGLLQAADVDLRDAPTYADAEASWAAAVDTLEPLAPLDAAGPDDAPPDETQRALQLRAHRRLGTLLHDWGQLVLPHFDRHEPGARELLERARAHRRRALELSPEAPDLALDLLGTQLNLASVLRYEERYDDALRVAEDALPGIQSLVDAHPELIHPRVQLATVHNQIGLIHDYLRQRATTLERQRAEASAALQGYAAARALLAELVERAPGLAELHSLLGVAELNVGGKRLDLGEQDAARAHFDAAVAQQLEAIRRKPDDLELRRRLMSHRVAQFDLAMRADDLRAALRAAAAIADSAPDEWRHQTKSAAHSARVVAQLDAGAGGTLTGEPRAVFRAEAVSAAMTALRAALAAGFPYLHELAEVDALDPLRGEPEFQALLAEVAAGAHETQPAPGP